MLWRLSVRKHGLIGSNCRGFARVAPAICLAIIGSGPAGFYTAHQLIKKNPNVVVDIFEKLPVPFGLVRFGVAPDHPEVKNVINQFTTLAKSDRCRFIGNVNIGDTGLRISQLKEYYSGIVLAYGAEDDQLLNIPGEGSKNVQSAKGFVGWYNGLPEYANLNPDLSGETAVIIGQGNVALDIARILLTPIALLKKTDICSHALEGLERSNIRRIIIAGRRGPLQVAFTIKELREMIRLPDCYSIIHSRDLDTYRSIVSDLPRPRKRITELMMKTADDYKALEVSNADSGSHCSKAWELKFLSSPVEILTNDRGGVVRGVRFERNQLDESNKPRGTGQYEEIECSLLVRSVGYKSVKIDDGIPFDTNRGVIPNDEGRVLDSNGEVIKGLYCSGWVKRGPVGVILTTMNDAFQTADSITQDISQNILHPIETDHDVLKLIERPVLFSDWERINQEEIARGQSRNKPREKIVSTKEILKIINE